MFKNFILLLFVIILASSCIAKKIFNQEEENNRIESISFPEDWTGRWQGDLMIYSGLGLQDQLKMELIIEPIVNSENYTFTIVYDTGIDLSKREYELIVVDQEQGLFIVDEKNTIMIESYFMGGKWFQRFEVAGSMLVCTIEQQGKNLVWEITSGKSEKISTTGDTNIEGILEVNTFPFGVYQRAVLSKF